MRNSSCGRILTVAFTLAIMPGLTSAADLSRYRQFQLGTPLPTVSKQTGSQESQVRTLHQRPALIQELDWRPDHPGSSSQTTAAKEVNFTFYNGVLYRIAVDYDRFETEGMTGSDVVDALTAIYGVAEKPAALADPSQGRYGDNEEVLARWQDPQYRLDLIRSSYGPTYKLIGVQKSLELPAKAAVLEAIRLDNVEAPQRDAARVASEQETARTKLEKARLVNKPKFRP